MTYREASEPTAEPVPAAKRLPRFPIPEVLARDLNVPDDYPFSTPGFDDELDALKYAVSALSRARGQQEVHETHMSRLQGDLNREIDKLAAAEAVERIAHKWLKELAEEVSK